MSDRITIKVSDLYHRAKQMKDDGMDVVRISILEEEELDDDDIIPACLWLSATSKKQSFMAVDYEPIDATQDE